MGTLEDLREEYRRDGVGVLLRELLEKIVWSTVRQYPPSEYSPYSNWDKAACEDVLSDWISERLWSRADLQAILSSAVTLQHLRAALTTSLRQHLTNKRRRSIASNLYKRIRVMLRDNSHFRSVSSPLMGAEERWTLAGQGSSAPSMLSVGELAQIACGLSDNDLEVVRYGPFSQKLSPILREPRLRDFLGHLLGRAEGSLTLSTIIEVMRFRFSLPTEEHTELVESIPSTRLGPADEAAVAINARSVVSRLNLEETKIVDAYFASQGAVSEAARLCECTPERVREVVHRAVAMICECSESEDDARAIMRSVESLLIQHGDL